MQLRQAEKRETNEHKTRVTTEKKNEMRTSYACWRKHAIVNEWTRPVEKE